MDQTTSFSSEVRSGLRVSVISLTWTLVAGFSAIAIGFVHRSLVLVSFGAIGLVDALGSAGLIVNFRHALRDEAISVLFERRAHTLVTAGMGTVGVATIGDSAYRLSTRPAPGSDLPGIVLAAVSIVVLTLLSRRKRHLGARIPSVALSADGWLSAIGAGLGVVALAGTGLETGLAWSWADPVGAIGVGAGALSLSIALFRGARP